MKGKLLVIEGTDCSGKETQSTRLVDYINNTGGKAVRISFPMYDTPTGRIVGGPFLGKNEICDGYFPEKSSNVDCYVASLYFAADRKYNEQRIIDALNNGFDVILDRYVESNMAHQGSKIDDSVKRLELYNFLYSLEYNLLKLPKPDNVVLLYMPTEVSKILKKNRASLDQNEMDESYLKKCENTYLELASLYNYHVINCCNKAGLRTIDDINDELTNYYDSNIRVRKNRL